MKYTEGLEAFEKMISFCNKKFTEAELNFDPGCVKSAIMASYSLSINFMLKLRKI